LLNNLEIPQAVYPRQNAFVSLKHITVAYSPEVSNSISNHLFLKRKQPAWRCSRWAFRRSKRRLRIRWL